MGNIIELALGVTRQVSAFRQVLAYQTMGVFIATALPGCVGVSKVNVDT